MCLDDRTWQRVLELLRQQPDVYVGKEQDCRRFIEAILWVARLGAQWRLLPEHYGKWNSVYQRFNRWSKRDIWQCIQEHFIKGPDLENLLIDSTSV